MKWQKKQSIIIKKSPKNVKQEKLSLLFFFWKTATIELNILIKMEGFI